MIIATTGCRHSRIDCMLESRISAYSSSRSREPRSSGKAVMSAPALKARVPAPRVSGGGPGAAQHDAAQIVLLGQGFHHHLQVAPHGEVEGVQHLGPVEADDGDRALAFDGDPGVGHEILLSGTVSVTRSGNRPSPGGR
jgi:hypothetical protein